MAWPCESRALTKEEEQGMPGTDVGATELPQSLELGISQTSWSLCDGPLTKLADLEIEKHIRLVASWWSAWFGVEML